MENSVSIKKRGKNFIPTDQDRELVLGLRAIGATHQRIGQVLGISHDTLVRHFPHELEMGFDRLKAEIASTLFRKALDGDTTCLIFLAKTRLGWTERIEVQTQQECQVILIDTSDSPVPVDSALSRFGDL